MSNSSEIYFNADILPNNFLKDNDSTTQPIMFSQQSINDIVSNMSEYDMSIVRFQCDASASLPLFIPIIQGGSNTDPNLTIYSVSMSIEGSGGGGVGNVGPTFIEYVSTSTINSGTLPQSYNNKYYWVYCLKDWTDMINTALNTTFQGILALSGVPSSWATCKPPKIVYDSVSDKFSLYVDSGLISATGNSLHIYFNSNLKLLLKHFQNVPNTVMTSGDTLYDVSIYNNFGLNTHTDVTDSNRLYYVMTQEASSSDCFSPISSIAFATTLPIESELVANPIYLSGSNISISNQNFSEKIISDITLPLSSVYDYKQVISYLPNIYRYVNLNNMNLPLKEFNFSLKWKCKLDGAYYGVTNTNNSYSSIKVLFKRRYT